MRRVNTLCLSYIMVCVCAFGAHAQAPPVSQVPHAVVKGQSSVPAGGTVILDAQESVCDPDQPLQWQAIEPPAMPLITADRNGRSDVLAFFVTDMDHKDYLVAVTATAVDPLTHHVRVNTTLVHVQAVSPTPPTPPTPPAPPMPPPLPVPTTPLAQSAQQYHTGFAAFLRALGDQIGSGQIPDKQGTVTSVGIYGKTFARALDAIVAGAIDATGKYTNPAAVKAALYDAAAACGG